MSPVRDTLVHSYLFLRRAIGLIGTALPVVLVLGGLLTDGKLFLSVSGYYWSGMRDVYVGSLCAVGVFLLSYRGYARIDDVVSHVAGVAAICVALFPTGPPVGETPGDKVVEYVHVGSAAVFFLSLAYFCLVLFRRSDPEDPVTARKVKRNGVYAACGVVILVCLALIVVCGLVFEAETDAYYLTLWLEFAATTAFGVAWAVKGEVILKDPVNPRIVAVE